MLGHSKSARLLTVIREEVTKASHSTPVLSSRNTAATSSLANEPSLSICTTGNTLSMISTPWSTESWVSDAPVDFCAQCDISSTSVTPRSSSSYGLSSDLIPFNKSTLTIYGMHEVDSISRSIRPLDARTASGLSSTLSSWTLESFTSSGWSTDWSSKLVKVNYPWSPFTEMSYTDMYPSSLDSLSHFSFPSPIIQGLSLEVAPRIAF